MALAMSKMAQIQGVTVKDGLSRLGMAAGLDPDEWAQFAAMVRSRLGMELGELARARTTGERGATGCRSAKPASRNFSVLPVSNISIGSYHYL
jgi:hypothetical protein